MKQKALHSSTIAITNRITQKIEIFCLKHCKYVCHLVTKFTIQLKAFIAKNSKSFTIDLVSLVFVFTSQIWPR